MQTEINTNIDKYSEGIANGLSFRLIVCVIAAVLVMLAAILLLPFIGIPMELAGMIGGVPGVFIASFGFFKKEGWYLDEIIRDKLLRFKCFKVDFESETMEYLYTLAKEDKDEKTEKL